MVSDDAGGSGGLDGARSAPRIRGQDTSVYQKRQTQLVHPSRYAGGPRGREVMVIAPTRARIGVLSELDSVVGTLADAGIA